jgi:putative tryptophan/tyrosine transport system substrate-binding protein
MRRRDFILLFGSAALAPRAARAQATNGRPRVGWLGFATKDSPIGARYLAQFLNGMHDLGYVDGQNLEMLYRYADLQPDCCAAPPSSSARNLAPLHRRDVF